jgi:CHAD domain-containing protein
MGYKLKAGQGIQKGIRRVLVEEIDDALRALTHPSRVASIHDARKRVKRIRAALRLARGALGRRTFTRENDDFRELGRRLSAARDAEVLVLAFDKIKPDFTAAPLRRGVGIVGRFVREKRRAVLKSVMGRGNAVDQARTGLRRARRRAQRLTVRGKEWPALVPGFARVYGQGQDRCEIAYDKQSPEDFHAWRRRVKDLTFQIRLLRGVWPAVFEAWVADLDALSDLLGDDHDLAVLHGTIGGELHDVLNPGDRDGLLAGIDRRRASLEADARPLGRRLYAEPVKSVSDRIEAYWSAWRLAKREE